MLQQFTWQQFLVAALVLTMIWYAGVILLFYRKELIAFLNKNKTANPPDEPLTHHWEKGVDILEKEEPDSAELLGKPKMPQGLSVVGSDEFSFAPAEDFKTQQLGLVPDVLEEIKEVFVLLARQDGTKKDFFDLAGQVRNKYPKIASDPNIGSINEFIAEHAPFHLSKEELEDLWI